MTKKKALIAGATGVVGRNLLRHLLGTGEWEIVALSRRTPDVEGAYTHIAVDLMNAGECKAMHGTKWYGMHLGPFKTPAKEDDPRHLPPNFYYDQWDYLVERQKGKRWTYSSARPHAISGFALGNHSNLTMVIAIYAAICKEL